MSYMQYKEGRLAGLVTCYMGAVLKATSLQERYKE